MEYLIVLKSSLLIIIIIYSIILIFQDIKTKTVNITSIAIFGIASFVYYLISLHGSFILFIIILSLGSFTKIFLQKQIIGTADYFISLFITPFLYNEDIPILLILIGMTGIFTSFLYKSKKIAFIPTILIPLGLINLYRFLY